MEAGALNAKGWIWVPAFFLAACSPSAPRILQTFGQITVVRDRGSSPTETLAAFVQVENSDGLDKVSALYVISDPAELYWKLEPGTWTRIDRPGEVWLGSGSLRSADRAGLPRGTYRVIVVVQDGQRATSTFFVNPPQLDKLSIDWPELAVAQGRVLITRPPPEFALWIYGSEEAILDQLVFDRGEFPLEEIQNNPKVNQRATRCWIYWYDERDGYGLLTGPFPLQEAP